MRVPNHIILDFTSSATANSSQYWTLGIVARWPGKGPLFLTNDTFLEKIKPHQSCPILDESKFDLKYVKPTACNQSGMCLHFFGYARTWVNGTYVPVVWRPPLNTLDNLINIGFLRKERLYTKLKYSRSPAYDIVSGGAAAIFAGLLGFLISEKFGLELVDSGDFYYLFMYCVFFAFALRPLVAIVSTNAPGTSFLDVVSLRRIVDFYSDLVGILAGLFK
jgi:hypothetical protein